MHAWMDEIMEKIILLEAFPGFYANLPFTVWNLLWILLGTGPEQPAINTWPDSRSAADPVLTQTTKGRTCLTSSFQTIILSRKISRKACH